MQKKIVEQRSFHGGSLLFFFFFAWCFVPLCLVQRSVDRMGGCSVVDDRTEKSTTVAIFCDHATIDSIGPTVGAYVIITSEVFVLVELMPWCG